MSDAGAAGADRVQAPFGRRAVTITRREQLGPYVVLHCEDVEGPPPAAGQFYMLMAARNWGGGAGGRPFLPRAVSVMRALRQDGRPHPALGSRDRPSKAPETGSAAAAVTTGRHPAGPTHPGLGSRYRPSTAPETGPVAVALTTGRHPAGRLELQFMLDVVGPGTRRLCELGEGDQLLLVGPLGRGFTAPRGARDAVLVGGGIGVAPLAIWQDQLDQQAVALLGFRDADHAQAAHQFTEAPRVATDDGSRGHHGFVTDLLAEELHLRPHSAVYACGPPAMLEAVRLLCAEREVPAQLALESGMACGFGACFGCVVHTRDGYVRLCVDGPVIGAERLESVLAGGVLG
ncbi:MAG: hypothetical protein ACLP01_09175 [Solirubrobacteraceae bacterium]